jgi:hypothetical protein
MQRELAQFTKEGCYPPRPCLRLLRRSVPAGVGWRVTAAAAAGPAAAGGGGTARHRQWSNSSVPCHMATAASGCLPQTSPSPVQPHDIIYMGPTYGAFTLGDHCSSHGELTETNRKPRPVVAGTRTQSPSGRQLAAGSAAPRGAGTTRVCGR